MSDLSKVEPQGRDFPGRVLAVDYGATRIGLALSDPLGVAIRQLEVVRGGRAACAEVVRIAREHGAGAVVVGLPLNMNGSEGREAGKAAAFAGRLAGLLAGEIPVYMQDERLTTAEAHGLLRAAHRRPSRQKQRVDMLSAQLILKCFLDAWRAGKCYQRVSTRLKNQG